MLSFRYEPYNSVHRYLHGLVLCMYVFMYDSEFVKVHSVLIVMSNRLSDRLVNCVYDNSMQYLPRYSSMQYAKVHMCSKVNRARKSLTDNDEDGERGS